ncbi:probable Histone-lysine N-methyltransferase ATXR5 [Tripterygium wilfordii]|uniref:probable Histone-lysine N-methyltransferase ATXR5 n=1 Tax=Tripterygium wilfordii TaxID=458696 RepID=UPI0018F7FC62|nr:probable Histone-lysine N-methyltransferase ATXR5 [Tripterygium wilfordii]
MAPANVSKAAARPQIGSRRRTLAPRQPTPTSIPHPKKMKPLSEVMVRAAISWWSAPITARQVVSNAAPANKTDELLLCDKCDKGFHMKCLRPVVVRVPIVSWLCPKCSGQRRVFSQKKIIDFFGIKKSPNEKKRCASPQGCI